VDYCWLDMVFGHPLQALQSTATAAVVTHQISRLFRGGGYHKWTPYQLRSTHAG
jgi:hypothetical protein